MLRCPRWVEVELSLAVRGDAAGTVEGDGVAEFLGFHAVGTVRGPAYSVAMRRLRSLSEAECYARCYGGWEATVHVLKLEPRVPRHVLAFEGEALRRRFGEDLDERDSQHIAGAAPARV